MSSPYSAADDGILVESITDWRGQDVVDREGSKVGSLEEVYYDGELDSPAFVAVKSGLISKSLTLAPLRGASVGRDFLRLRVTKKQVKDAPSFDTGVELTIEQEESAYRHFDLDYRPTRQGGRRLARR